MNSTDSITLKLLSGSPIFIGEDICAFYPCTLRDIAVIGYDTFWQYLQVLTMEKPVMDKNSKDELKKIIEPLTTFQYIILLTQIDPEINTCIKQALKFFLHENVFFSLEPAGITIGPLEEKHIIEEKDFLELQLLLKRFCWLDSAQLDDITIHEDDDPAIRLMKEQMAKNRARLAKAKAKQGHNKSDIEFSDLVASVATGNCGLNINNIWDITYYAFHDQLKRMGWREQFDINNRAAMAGAKIKKTDLQHWIKSIKSDDKK